MKQTKMKVKNEQRVVEINTSKFKLVEYAGHLNGIDQTAIKLFSQALVPQDEGMIIEIVTMG